MNISELSKILLQYNQEAQVFIFDGNLNELDIQPKDIELRIDSIQGTPKLIIKTELVTD